MAFLDLLLPPASVDLNVSPDKRKLFVASEAALLAALRDKLAAFFAPDSVQLRVQGGGRKGLVQAMGAWGQRGAEGQGEAWQRAWQAGGGVALWLCRCEERRQRLTRLQAGVALAMPEWRGGGMEVPERRGGGMAVA